MGLTVNEDKISTSRDLRDIDPHTVTVHNYTFDIVKEFIYPGAAVTPKMMSAWRSSAGLIVSINNWAAETSLVRHNYQQDAYPPLACAEAWTLLSTDSTALRVLERKSSIQCELAMISAVESTASCKSSSTTWTLCIVFISCGCAVMSFERRRLLRRSVYLMQGSVEVSEEDDRVCVERTKSATNWRLEGCVTAGRNPLIRLLSNWVADISCRNNLISLHALIRFHLLKSGHLNL